MKQLGSLLHEGLVGRNRERRPVCSADVENGPTMNAANDEGPVQEIEK
jgi:hypothetical protein